MTVVYVDWFVRWLVGSFVNIFGESNVSKTVRDRGSVQTDHQ